MENYITDPVRKFFEGTFNSFQELYTKGHIDIYRQGEDIMVKFVLNPVYDHIILSKEKYGIEDNFTKSYITDLLRLFFVQNNEFKAIARRIHGQVKSCYIVSLNYINEQLDMNFLRHEAKREPKKIF